jgi:hypothetical protein
LSLAQDRANQGWPPFSSLESELYGVGNWTRHDECKQTLVVQRQISCSSRLSLPRPESLAWPKHHRLPDEVVHEVPSVPDMSA